MSYTPGPWSQGRTLMTSQTRRWSAAELTENDLVERRMVFANFLALDDGRSRRRVAVCESEADARLIAAAPELLEVLKNVTAHLVAAHSLLQRGGKSAAASDAVFDLMLSDYEKSFESGRAAIAKAEEVK